jgi:hypothetical protein
VSLMLSPKVGSLLLSAIFSAEKVAASKSPTIKITSQFPSNLLQISLNTNYVRFVVLEISLKLQSESIPTHVIPQNAVVFIQFVSDQSTLHETPTSKKPLNGTWREWDVSFDV